RQLFYVRGGRLSRQGPRGRLEFREIPGGRAVITALHNFSPSLPWVIYRWTQAWVHLATMRLYRVYLLRRIRKKSKPWTTLAEGS
ncbi:MAG: hypothetical protein KF731_13020, partial [Thauera sp.]|nr:hypothetical protein [Thauera sp.]